MVYILIAGGNDQFASSDFRERAAMFDHTVRGALSPPHPTSVSGFATQDHAQVRDSNAAEGNTRHGGHFGKPIKEGVSGLQRGPKAKPSRPTCSIFRSDRHLLEALERLSPPINHYPGDKTIHPLIMLAFQPGEVAMKRQPFAIHRLIIDPKARSRRADMPVAAGCTAAT